MSLTHVNKEFRKLLVYTYKIASFDQNTYEMCSQAHIIQNWLNWLTPQHKNKKQIKKNPNISALKPNMAIFIKKESEKVMRKKTYNVAFSSYYLCLQY